ncbi:unnamed protein product [Rhizophagus irregularis]|nr:unnamed protein product [Rhizophagus irregularis]
MSKYRKRVGRGGYNKLVTYLKIQSNKSYRGFFKLNRNMIFFTTKEIKNWEGQGLKTYWEKLIREYSSVNENQQKNAQWITILHHLHTKKEFVQNEDDGDVILELEM